MIEVREAPAWQVARTLTYPLEGSRRQRVAIEVSPSGKQLLIHAQTGRTGLNLSGPGARNAALYFPCLRMVDPLRDSRVDTFMPGGAVAGIMARTDVARGVWKAPAGLDAALNGVQDLQINLNDLQNGQLNPLGINCLRSMGVNGRVVWGARTLRGADVDAEDSARGLLAVIDGLAPAQSGSFLDRQGQALPW